MKKIPVADPPEADFSAKRKRMGRLSFPLDQNHISLYMAYLIKASYLDKHKRLILYAQHW